MPTWRTQTSRRRALRSSMNANGAMRCCRWRTKALENNLSQDGLHAWGRLYDQLAGTLACKVPTQDGVQTMGLAQASGMIAGREPAAPRGRLAGHQRRLGRTRRVLRRRHQRHRRLAAGDVSAARQAGPAGSLPGRRPAPEPHHQANARDGAASRPTKVLRWRGARRVCRPRPTVPATATGLGINGRRHRLRRTRKANPCRTPRQWP